MQQGELHVPDDGEVEGVVLHVDAELVVIGVLLEVVILVIISIDLVSRQVGPEGGNLYFSASSRLRIEASYDHIELGELALAHFYNNLTILPDHAAALAKVSIRHIVEGGPFITSFKGEQPAFDSRVNSLNIG